MKEVEAVFSQLVFQMALNILDPKALPGKLDLLNMMWMSLTNSSLTMVMTNLIFIRPLINVKKLYSRTSLNNHPHKTTTRLRRPVLSPPKEIPIQWLLYKTTNYLTRPATTFFVSQVKKTCLKRLLQNFTQPRNGKQSWTMHKK